MFVVVWDLSWTVLWAVSVGLLVSGSHRFAALQVPDRLTSRFAATLVVVWSCVVLVASFSGFLGMFHPWVFQLSLAVIGFAFRRWFPPTRNGRPTGMRIFSKSGRQRAVRLGSALMVSSMIAHVLMYGVSRYPVDWDSLAYHLPIVDHWIQTADLFNQRCAFWYVPGNNELVTYFWVAGYSGDFFAGLTNLFVALLLLCVVNEALIDARVPAVMRLAACFSVSATSVVSRQLISQENDLAVATLLVSAACFAWRWLADDRQRLPYLAAMSIGLLFGIKYYAIGYALVVVGVVAAFALRTGGWKSTATWLTCCVTAIVLLAGVWYGRNWLLEGTPLFPKGFKALGMADQWDAMRPGNRFSTLMRGGDAEIFRKLSWAWAEQDGPSTWLATMTGVCVSIPIGLYYWWSKPKQNYLVFLAWLTLGSTCVYVMTPNVIETVFGTQNMLAMRYHSVRFGFALAAIATVLCFATVAWHRGRLGQFLGIVVAVLVGVDVILHATVAMGLTAWPTMFRIEMKSIARDAGEAWFFWPLATVDIALIYFIACESKGWLSRHMRTAGIACAGLVFVGVAYASLTWHRQYESFYSARDTRPTWQSTIDAAMVDESEPRIMACFYRYYSLLGSYRQRDVVRPLYMPTLDAVQQEIHQWQPDIIVTFHEDRHWTKTYALVPEWIQNHPEAFRQRDTAGRFLVAVPKHKEMSHDVSP